MTHQPQPAEVAVLIVCHNGAGYLPECLDSLLASDDAPLIRHIVVVDNASTDSSADLVARHHPDVLLIRSPQNLGFAAGNNLGWQAINQRWPRLDYLCLLNQDTVVPSGWLQTLVGHLQQHPDVGSVQPLLMLHPQSDRINSAGNRSHYLGFGFTRAFGQADCSAFSQPDDIDFASGAALVVQAALLRSLGLFESGMVAYLEDADLGWKLRQAGWRIQLVPQARVYHKYEFKRDFRHYCHLERNRWWLLLVYYRLPTLLLILPAFALMECGQWLFALRHGLGGQKCRATAYFLSPRNWRSLLRLRRQARRRRVLSDRRFLGRFAGAIDSPLVASPLLRYVANPLLAAWWSVVRRLICW